MCLKGVDTLLLWVGVLPLPNSALFVMFALFWFSPPSIPLYEPHWSPNVEFLFAQTFIRMNEIMGSGWMTVGKWQDSSMQGVGKGARESQLQQTRRWDAKGIFARPRRRKRNEGSEEKRHHTIRGKKHTYFEYVHICICIKSSADVATCSTIGTREKWGGEQKKNKPTFVSTMRILHASFALSSDGWYNHQPTHNSNKRNK